MAEFERNLGCKLGRSCTKSGSNDNDSALVAHVKGLFEATLEDATQITKALSHLHRQNVIHRASNQPTCTKAQTVCCVCSI